ncbi:MAG TPA: hypothetical protein VGG27_13735 [Magnetospirillaceae bacterium]|jgi:hypothetical protein
MALPKPPPAIEIPPDTKRAILVGVRKILEIFQSEGKFQPGINHVEILHEPELLAAYIKTFRTNPALYSDIVVGYDGRAITANDPDKALVCGVSLAQVQQLMVKTCARHLFLEDDDDQMVTKTVTTKRFGFFKEKTQVTERVERRDPRALREILSFIAFDWQLPLLADYADLTLQQLSELGENLLALRTPIAVRELAKFDYNQIRKARAALGPEFTSLLEVRPAAMQGALYWPKDMYAFFRSILGPKFYDFMARDENFFMQVGTMDKAVMRTYADSLAYIAKENLLEMQRLNIDRTDVLMQVLRATFGPKLVQLLTLPQSAKEVLRRPVEGLVHMHQNKDHMLQAQMVTWGALAPRVEEWLARQPKAV